MGDVLVFWVGCVAELYAPFVSGGAGCFWLVVSPACLLAGFGLSADAYPLSCGWVCGRGSRDWAADSLRWVGGVVPLLFRVVICGSLALLLWAWEM